MDVAQIVVEPAAARRAPAWPSSATPWRWARWWRTVPQPTASTWSAGDGRGPRRRPVGGAARPAAQPAGSARGRRRPRRRRRTAAGPRTHGGAASAESLAECSAEAGKPVVAAFTGILDPSVYVEGMVGAAGQGPPCRASPTPAPPWPRSRPWCGTRSGCPGPRALRGTGGLRSRPARARDLEVLLRRRRGRAAQAAGPRARRVPAGALRHRACCPLRALTPRTKPCGSGRGSAGRWR